MMTVSSWQVQAMSNDPQRAATIKTPAPTTPTKTISVSRMLLAPERVPLLVPLLLPLLQPLPEPAPEPEPEPPLEPLELLDEPSEEEPEDPELPPLLPDEPEPFATRTIRELSPSMKRAPSPRLGLTFALKHPDVVDAPAAVLTGSPLN
jgi:hypothetical protein